MGEEVCFFGELLNRLSKVEKASSEEKGGGGGEGRAGAWRGI